MIGKILESRSGRSVPPPSEVYPPCFRGVRNKGGGTLVRKRVDLGAAGAENFEVYCLFEASMSALPIGRAYMKCFPRGP